MTLSSTTFLAGIKASLKPKYLGLILREIPRSTFQEYVQDAK